jgi:NTE family protein
MQKKMNWVTDIQYVIFSGGGVRGLAFLGAYQVMLAEFRKNKRDFYGQIQGFAGSSAGSFMALLACLGCTEKEMMQAALTLEGPDLDSHLDFLLLAQDWGFYDKQRIVQFLRGLLKHYAQNEDITFEQLLVQTRKRLVVGAVCLNTGEMHYFSAESTPQLEVWRGVMASMSIPLIFPPSRIGQRMYVDAGLCENLPLKIFPLAQTLAFLLVRNTSTEIHGFRDYLQRLFYVPLNALETEQIKTIPLGLQNRIVRINTGDISTFEFHITEKEKQELIWLGAVTMHRLLYPEVLLSQTRHLVWTSVVQYLQEITHFEPHLPEVSPLTDADKTQIKLQSP